MRIVAGSYGGRKLLVPKGRDVRPTSDKVRGAIFNMLRGYDAIDDAHVLDAFCGTGALGLEAISQGASSAVFVDKAQSSLALARQNAAALGVQEVCGFLRKDAVSYDWSSETQHAFDLIFLDPPYRNDFSIKALENITKFKMIREGSIIVFEVERDFDYAFHAPFSVLSEKIYGDTKVFLVRYDSDH